jgi:tat pathway signal sequence domain protein
MPIKILAVAISYNQDKLFGVKSLLFYQRDVQPFFCISAPAVLGMVKQQCNMQQTIHFDNSAKEQQSIDVRATIQHKIQSINLWLDTKSEFYSRICEFTVTRRLALRINLVTLCMGFTAVCVEQHPTTALISVLCAGYLVHRVNKSDKEGGKK